MHDSTLRSQHLGLVVLGVATLAACDRSYPSLDGPEPEGCDQDAYSEDALTADLAYLASPELDGRAPGSAGDRAARDFVEKRFACLGLRETGTSEGYQQPFTSDDGYETGNVLGMIPGSGAGVSDEFIVLTAHIDHFGDGFLGANDNASGLTALLAIAGELANTDARPDRNIVFAAVGSEETGFEGSYYLMHHVPPEIERDKIVYNVNMDMVGTYIDSETLYIFGAYSGTPGRDAIKAHKDAYPRLDLSMGEGSTESDNWSFCDRDIPYVFFWTEDPDCYHRRCDTSARIDFDGMTEIVPLIGDVSLELANSSEDLAKTGCED